MFYILFVATEGSLLAGSLIKQPAVGMGNQKGEKLLWTIAVVLVIL